MEPEHIEVKKFKDLENIYRNVYEKSDRLQKPISKQVFQKIMARIDTVILDEGFKLGGEEEQEKKERNIALKVSTQRELIQNIILNFYSFLEKTEFQDDAYLQSILTQKKPTVESYYRVFEQAKATLDFLIVEGDLVTFYLSFCKAFAQYQGKNADRYDEKQIKECLIEGVKTSILIKRQNGIMYSKNIYGETLHGHIYVNTYLAEVQEKKILEKFNQLLKIYYLVTLIHQLTHYIIRSLGQVEEGDKSFDNSTINNIKQDYKDIKDNQYNLTWDQIQKFSDPQILEELKVLLKGMKPLEKIYEDNQRALVKQILRALKHNILTTNSQAVKASTRRIVTNYYENGKSFPEKKEDNQNPTIQKLKDVWTALLQTDDDAFKNFGQQYNEGQLRDQDFRISISRWLSTQFFFKVFGDTSEEEQPQIINSLLPQHFQTIKEIKELDYWQNFSSIQVITSGVILHSFPKLQEPFYNLFLYYRTFKSLQQLQKQIKFYVKSWKNFPQMFKQLTITNLMTPQAGYLFEYYLIPSVAINSRIYDSDVQVLQVIQQSGKCSKFKWFGPKKGNKEQISLCVERGGLGKQTLDLSGAVCGVPLVCRQRAKDKK